MAERTYLVARWIRIWHWTNAALIVLLGLTGMSIHFADPALPLVDFALAVRLHNIAGVLLIGAYGFFVVANIVTGNWWHFVPKPPGILRRILIQARWYGIGIFRGEPHPHHPSPDEHFNALQAVTYWKVMYLLLPVNLLTGLIYLYPEFAPDTLFGPKHALAYLLSVPNLYRAKPDADMSDPAVRLVQWIAATTIDGSFGDGLDGRVRRLQKWAGLYPDGNVGDDTKRKITI